MNEGGGRGEGGGGVGGGGGAQWGGSIMKEGLFLVKRMDLSAPEEILSHYLNTSLWNN